MKTSDRGIELIKKYEGCVLKVYLDAVKVKTAGYGHTGADVNALAVGAPITKSQAEKWLKDDLAKFEAKVEKYNLRYGWTQNEFDALCCFAYNIGSIDQLTANGTRSKSVIAEKMTAYNKAGGRILDGLTKRRREEQKLFKEKVIWFERGITYTTKTELYVHDTPAGIYTPFLKLTTNAKKNAYMDKNGYGILVGGTRVTCKETMEKDGDTWMKIPSGWIHAANAMGDVYVK